MVPCLAQVVGGPLYSIGVTVVEAKVEEVAARELDGMGTLATTRESMDPLDRSGTSGSHVRPAPIGIQEAHNLAQQRLEGAQATRMISIESHVYPSARSREVKVEGEAWEESEDRLTTAARSTLYSLSSALCREAATE